MNETVSTSSCDPTSPDFPNLNNKTKIHQMCLKKFESETDTENELQLPEEKSKLIMFFNLLYCFIYRLFDDNLTTEIQKSFNNVCSNASFYNVYSQY